MIVTDNADGATYVGTTDAANFEPYKDVLPATTGGWVQVRARPGIFWADAEVGNDTSPESYRGRWDWPYLKLETAINEIPRPPASEESNAASWEVRTRSSEKSDVGSVGQTFVPTATIVMPFGTRLVLGQHDQKDGKATTLVSANFDDPVFQMDKGCEIVGGWIRNTDPEGVGVYIPSASGRVRLVGVALSGNGLTGLDMQTYGNDLAIFEQSSFTDNGSFGAHLHGTGNSPQKARFLSCTFSGNGEAEAMLETLDSDSLNSILFDTCSFGGNRTKLYLKGAHGVTVRSCTFENNASMDTNQSAVVIRAGTGTGGTARQHYAYIARFIGCDFLSITTGNRVETDLAEAIDDAITTEVCVTSSGGFPSGVFTILVDSEKMRVLSRAGIEWTVRRGVDGTTAAMHNMGADVIWAAWDRGKGLLFDIDQAFDVQVRDNQMRALTSSLYFPLVVLGKDAARCNLDFGQASNTGDRSTAITDPQVLFLMVGKTDPSGSITSPLDVLSATAGFFTPDDVDKVVIVDGAASGGANLRTTIKSYDPITPNQVVLQNAASAAVSSKLVRVEGNPGHNLAEYWDWSL